MLDELTRVLLVEDNEADARAYERILGDSKGSEYEIELAGQLEEAKSRLRDGDYDIVLLDLGLPDSRGVSTVEGVQEVDPHVPIVVLTGLDYEKIAERSLEQGVQDYLVKKDITPALIKRSIRYAIRRARTQRELKRSERRFRELAENIQEVFWMIDGKEQRFLYVSPAFEDIWGCPGKTLMEDPEAFFRTVHEDDLERVRTSHPISSGSPGELEYRIIATGGETVWIRDRSFRVSEGSEEHRIAGLAEDISEQKNRRRNLEENLVTKDTLLTEVHHRVKNNLDLIRRQLNLKMRRVENETMSGTLREVKDRIESVSLIHEKLSGISRQNQVDFYEFVSSILSDLQNLRELSKSIRTRIEVEPIRMNLDSALSCGLVLQELVTNAYEHAFPEGKGLVEVFFRKREEEAFELIVRDNGAGFVPGGTERDSEDLGMRLIRKIVQEQMRGTLEVDTEGGTTVRIQFSPEKVVGQAA